MSRLGHTTKRYYKETGGVKVTSGEKIKAGTLLTREGHRWKAGRNVIGLNHLTAACDGEVYFTRKKNRYRKVVTYINIKGNKSKN